MKIGFCLFDLPSRVCSVLDEEGKTFSEIFSKRVKPG